MVKLTWSHKYFFDEVTIKGENQIMKYYVMMKPSYTLNKYRIMIKTNKYKNQKLVFFFFYKD